MEHPNAAALRAGYDAFERGDAAALVGLFSEDCVFHVPGTHQNAGSWRGREQYLEYFARFADLTGGSFRSEVIDVCGSDAHAVAIHHATGQRNGRTLDCVNVLVCRFEGGTIVEATELKSNQRMEDEFWSWGPYRCP